MYGAKSKAFTLIEVIFVFAIIAILLAILLPGMSKLKQYAQKLRDVSHLKKINETWREAVINRGWTINNAVKSYITGFAEYLAGRDRTSLSDIILNDPHVYISPGDKYASKIQQEALCYMQNGRILTYTDAFTGTTNFMVSDNPFLSYCIVCNLSAKVPLETTPFAFTRGLREDGKWDEKGGLYGSSGGYVVYCDGHVVWFDGSKPARFLKWDKSGYTSNIREAIPNSSGINCGNPGTNTNYRSDGFLVLLQCAGTGGS
ncbi:MAG: prepilin-type N-terminal cleavage/methylation domain-containing protein [Puniceicoccales bacterium]|jgi:prepilin-type N-terminal cleavage/methylation domain-containing protein|nr:prepilin-type N-terminal cleavage/methylation domain-containing protein [Puniceicoccales bacterium]